MCLRVVTSSRFSYKSIELLIVSKFEHEQLEVHNVRSNTSFPILFPEKKKTFYFLLRACTRDGQFNVAESRIDLCWRHQRTKSLARNICGSKVIKYIAYCNDLTQQCLWPKVRVSYFILEINSRPTQFCSVREHDVAIR
jgi:hypothetical protein